MNPSQSSVATKEKTTAMEDATIRAAIDDAWQKVQRWSKDWADLETRHETAVLEGERAKRGCMGLRRQMTHEEKHLLNAELQLDSFIQEKVKNTKKLATAIAEIRAIRNERIKRGFNWQYTLTNPKIPDEEQARKWFGYPHDRKKWVYPSNGVSPQQVIEESA